MSGVVTSVLTDKELDILIGWAAEVAAEGPGGFLPFKEQELRAKLLAWRGALACDAGKCAQLKGRDDV
jgi:hypothetical protein